MLTTRSDRVALSTIQVLVLAVVHFPAPMICVLSGHASPFFTQAVLCVPVIVFIQVLQIEFRIDPILPTFHLVTKYSNAFYKGTTFAITFYLETKATSAACSPATLYTCDRVSQISMLL
jgi:hypothetical protein